VLKLCTSDGNIRPASGYPLMMMMMMMMYLPDGTVFLLVFMSATCTLSVPKCHAACPQRMGWHL